jgi:hypothetical protein
MLFLTTIPVCNERLHVENDCPCSQFSGALHASIERRNAAYVFRRFSARA